MATAKASPVLRTHQRGQRIDRDVCLLLRAALWPVHESVLLRRSRVSAFEAVHLYLDVLPAWTGGDA